MPVKEELFNPAIWFKLDIQGKSVGYFTEASGLSAEVETFSYNEGGRNDYIHKLPTRMKHPNLVLKRGMTTVKDLQTWFDDSYNGPSRTTITVTMLNELGDTITHLDVRQRLPGQVDGAAVQLAAEHAGHGGHRDRPRRDQGGLMAVPQQFQKAKLNIEGIGEVPVLFNPTEYSIAKSNEWKYEKVNGKAFGKMQFGGGNPREVTLNLHARRIAAWARTRTCAT